MHNAIIASSWARYFNDTTTDGKVIDHSPTADGSLTNEQLTGVAVGIPAEAAAQIAVSHGVELRNVPDNRA